MPVHERRQHFRVDDHLYFDYRVLKPSEPYTEQSISKELLGENGLRYMEAIQYFHGIDLELAELTQSLSINEPTLAHYLNLLNAKVDYLSRQILMSNKAQMHKVNISLGGMAFKTATKIQEKTPMKIIIYTKPKMVPIIVDATVVYSQYQSENNYRTAVQFGGLTQEQEQLLSQHIMQVQIKTRAD